jgi:hypothetical protein
MTNYPANIDDDRSINRIDDNLSELGTSVINQLRDAIFAIEKTLGINPQGSKSNINDRISILIGPDGEPVAAALQNLGLVTLPITDNQVADNAGIKESKLTLDHSTSDLSTQIINIQAQLNNVENLAVDDSSDLLLHISGAQLLTDHITPARHVASQIDINAVPHDLRDSYVWVGLKDINGNQRSATQVAEALLQINNELVGHENTTTLAHPATAITVDTTGFVQLPADIQNVQQVIDFFDNQDALSNGVDRATLNSNGIPRTARIQDLNNDGYTVNIVPVTKIQAYLSEPNQLGPNDNINNGDDVIKFFPINNTGFSFDSQFTNVKVGDIVRVNYGNGIEAIFPIISIRFVPGSEWTIRISSNNLFNADGMDGYDGYARIDQSNFDRSTWGVCAAAGAVPSISQNSPVFDTIIVGNPKGAVAVGIGFDPNQIDANHYLLYLRLYQNGNVSSFVDLHAIDVSGNLGATPGRYSIDYIVEQTNKQFRKAGYNYRFIAFNQKGEFGIMLADSYNGASFSIIAGQVSGISLIAGPYVNNVIGDATDLFDALGLGGGRAGFATAIAPNGYSAPIAAANFSTLIIPPVSDRNYLVNGTKRDFLNKSRFTEGDGYWIATITNITPSISDGTSFVTYSIPLDLNTEGLDPGKTIVVQPIDNNNSDISGYGRFIISDLSFSCVGNDNTNITVLNAIHGTGNSNQAPLPLSTQVKIYFSKDSVSFNLKNMVSSDDPSQYQNYHEVFLDNLGRTISVERARMSKATFGAVRDLAVSGWNIRNVSQKLKGYRSSDLRFYIYLNIVNYNSVTGEFDGYIGDLSGLNVGPVVRGKKNHPIRFFDSSFVNFIDIEFREDLSNPGTPMSSTGFAPIELFNTFIGDDEFFIIAGVSHDGVNFRAITDLREFGTLSEENFTDSAINFIQSGERYLHTNGVVRGFDYEHADGTNTILKFTGGMALVNGGFVAVDSIGVKIPQIKSLSSSVVEFFICVTENGQLKAVVKDIGFQFFESISGYFVESLSFKEIVDKRKDLTIISRVKVQIASGQTPYQLLEVTDARKHIINQDLGSFTWAYGMDGYNVSFITTDALMNWVNEYGVNEVNVKYVKINSELQLGFNNFVTLKGGIYEINSVKGLSLKSGNWKIAGGKVYYYPYKDTNFYGGSVFTPDASDIFNTNGSAVNGIINWGGIVIDSPTVNIDNFGIEDTYFYSDAAQRPPFFAVYALSGNFSNGNFINNKFSDTNAGNALAYAFVNTNTIPLSSLVCSDILVSRTKINAQQGIIVTGRANPDVLGTYLSASAVAVDNFIIDENRFGLIGTIVAGNLTAGITISENTTQLIITGVTATMHPLSKTYSYKMLNVHKYPVDSTIIDNSAYYIKAESTPGSLSFKTIVSDNKIRNQSVFNNIVNLIIPDLYTSGLTIVSNSIDTDTSVVCTGNTIDGLNVGYIKGIHIDGAGTITGNIVNNIATNGWGIWNSSQLKSTITGNTINKADATIINGFIHAGAASSIHGNTLSHFNLGTWWTGAGDGYDSFGISTSSNMNGIDGCAFASHNVNQVVKLMPSLSSAIPLLHMSASPNTNSIVNPYENNERLLFCQEYALLSNPGLYSPNRGLAKVYFDRNERVVWEWWDTVDNDGTVGLVIPLSSILPDQAFLLSLQITVSLNTTWSIFNNNNSNPSTTFPQLSLELDGQVVASVDATPGGNFTLKYYSNVLQTNVRPTNPGPVKNMVLKMRQGEPGGDPSVAVYGNWPQPLAIGVPKMVINDTGQPPFSVVYMY